MSPSNGISINGVLGPKLRKNSFCFLFFYKSWFFTATYTTYRWWQYYATTFSF